MVLEGFISFEQYAFAPAFKEFKTSCELALAVIEQDSEKLYDANKYQVLNTIYKNLTGVEGSLTAESTEEGISTVEKTLTDIYGEDTFTQEKSQVLTALLFVPL